MARTGVNLILIDRDIVGCNWIELPAGKYSISKSKLSVCQYEVDVAYVAPFAIVMFDSGAVLSSVIDTLRFHLLSSKSSMYAIMSIVLSVILLSR